MIHNFKHALRRGGESNSLGSHLIYIQIIQVQVAPVPPIIPPFLKILEHIGRRFDPLVLPGRAPPLFDGFTPDPFPDYGPQ